MKKFDFMRVIFFLILISAIFPISAMGVDDATNRAKINISKTFGLEIDTKNILSDQEVSALHYILSFAYEDNVHKMRGAYDNVTYVHPDGREAVYDGKGKLVLDGINEGTFNESSYEKPFQKFAWDMLPWLLNGASEADPTSFEERLFYYLLDVSYGLEQYVFEAAPNEIPFVTYKKLNPFEKQIVQLFDYLIFYDGGFESFSEENLRAMRNDETLFDSFVTKVIERSGFKY